MCPRISIAIVNKIIYLYHIMKRMGDLINEIIDGIDRLVQNIRKLYTNIKMAFKTKKNITL